ncbi:hypothetical protein DOY81_007593 [Sarcophaga bullata]|nr:hypothetical protein DOY81_007593 [Sarcophaga bullata]
MRLHFTTIFFIIFENIQKILTQGVPISPCPKMFQYRFDGTEWFGILSVRNPDFAHTLHLRNYLGEIELLTRGQFLSDAPVLYRIKFPKSPYPPKLLQVTTNNQVVCLGGADHSIFVTQIQLEHTRKFTFLPDDMPPPPLPPPSSPSSPSSSSTSSSSPTMSTMGLAGGHSAIISALPIITGLKESPLLPTNLAFGTKHLPVSNAEKKPMRLSKDICGTIDDRIRFQVLQALQQTTARTAMVSATATTSSSSSSSSVSTTPKQHNEMLATILLSTLLTQQNNATSKDGKLSANNTSSLLEKERVENDTGLPPLVTSDTDARPVDGSMVINELPTITRGSWPWLAAVYVNNLTTLAYQCGGTLISSRVIISAAHCFQLFKKLYTANEILVFLGRHNLKNWNEDGSLAAPVDDIFIHPDFNKHLNSYDADIAVVILKNEVRFNTFIRPACMWSGPINTEYIEGEHGIVVGWALGGFSTSKHTATAGAVPKIVSTPIVSNKVCFQASTQYRSLSSNRTFCAGVMLQNQDSITLNQSGFDGKPLSFQHPLHQGPCTGDSGAGLMLFKNNRWILRGTVSGSLPVPQTSDDSPVTPATSRSNHRCSNNQYVIYTDVAKFLDWIFAFTI